MSGDKADIFVTGDKDGDQPIRIRVEWSRHDKVTLKFSTEINVKGVAFRSHELIDRRAVKALKTLTGSVEERCKVFAEQKAEATAHALKLYLAAFTQARHVQPEETN